MAEDPKWELAILATVQGFYTELLREFVHGDVPTPAALSATSLEETEDVPATLDAMRRWLRLLDLAVTPAMLRRAFTSDTDPEIAEALLRYFVRSKDEDRDRDRDRDRDKDKNQDKEEDKEEEEDRDGDLRDKTDLVVTFLYRYPRVPGQWEQQGRGLDGSLPLSTFEIALLEILADQDTPSLAEEHLQILGRLDPLLEQARQFRDLNDLIDSGIIVSVRRLKHSLGASFYHPGVLSRIASYNSAFGKKFNELLGEATTAIQGFACELEEQGGSILGNVEGVDVTVEDVTGFGQAALLRLDYSSALDRFRRISQLTKMLKRHPPLGRRNIAARQPLGRKPSIEAASTSAPPATSSQPSSQSPTRDPTEPRFELTTRKIAAEQTKLLKVEESIRLFVRVADPKFRLVVPMRFFNLTLSFEEAEAYAADYLEEKSLRARAARALMRLASSRARITLEVAELKRNENSPSLWRMHADALFTLLEMEPAVEQEGARLKALIEARGGGREIDLAGLERSTETLRACSSLARNALRKGTEEKGSAAGAD